MNNILLISIVIFLMLMFNKKEHFTIPPPEVQPDLKCKNNSNQLSIVNMYADEVCQDNEVNGKEVNNQRINCRNFVERQILISNDNKQICDSDNVIPIKNSDAPLNSFIHIQDTGMNSNINEDLTSDNYPFKLNQVNTDLFNLDDKL